MTIFFEGLFGQNILVRKLFGRGHVTTIFSGIASILWPTFWFPHYACTQYFVNLCKKDTEDWIYESFNFDDRLVSEGMREETFMGKGKSSNS